MAKGHSCNGREGAHRERWNDLRGPTAASDTMMHSISLSFSALSRRLPNKRGSRQRSGDRAGMQSFFEAAA
ncbi:MAG: hypothetical protein K0S86_1336 [Geminicoccaceae bacterium]|jgi:hypothetical protein|nr:hypothetical protein [Geminicoccaceae bacterium]